MSRIVSDMLTLTRMERGADVFEAAPVDLSALADELCRDMALIADQGHFARLRNRAGRDR